MYIILNIPIKMANNILQKAYSISFSNPLKKLINTKFNEMVKIYNDKRKHSFLLNEYYLILRIIK